MPREVTLNASALSSPSALFVDVSVSSLRPDVKTPDPGICLTKFPEVVSRIASGFNSRLKGLIDSGSSDCFVSRTKCESDGFLTYTIPPVTLRYLDGSTSMITEQCRLLNRFPSGDVHFVEFYVTHLDSPCDLVLGYSWLHRFNPSINWSLSTLSFRPNELSEFPVATTQTFKSDVPSVSPDPDEATPAAPEISTPAPAILPSSKTSSPPSAPPEQPKSPKASTPSPVPSPEVFMPSPFTMAPPVSLVSAAAYSAIIRDPGTQQFVLRAQLTDESYARAAAIEEELDITRLPSEYHDFADVFSEKEANTLPPHRDFDLRIDTIDGQEPPIGHVYSISEKELATLREFIDKNLKSGFIYPSRSSHGAPILFARKKDGSLRLCVDYRGLNKITKKDRYPLPLIADLLDAPGKARIYTKLDLRHAYHLLRIAEGDEPKTAFRTRYGSFEFRVVPFGLTNAPAAFQRFLNDIFADLLDVYVIVYLDDILIYSDDKENHTKHVREVLRRLREAGLYCNLPKCEFGVDTTEYLGYILTPEGFKMSPAKVSAIVDWPVPRKVKDIQSFLGFCNFYRRFIWNYSDITIPMTRLTHANIKWNWSDECQQSFETLKRAFTEAPILHHWVPDRQITVETDASDYATAAILSITGDDGDLHPVAFRSRTLGPSELNYDTHDKECLAIFDAFTVWRHYLEGAVLPIDVVTDHKNLEYFATTKVLTRRQVRWSEYLCRFNMVIRFRPGRLGGKPDALTRRWDVYPKEGDKRYGNLNPHNFRPIFGSEQLSASLRATFMEAPVLRASVILDTAKLHNDIRTHLADDPASVAGISAATSGKPSRWTIDTTGLLRYDGRIWVPLVSGTSTELRTRVLQFKHDHVLAGHFGQNRTLALVRREYTWPECRTFVKQFCASCVLCRRNVKPRHRPYGLLKPLPVPLRPWHSISLDFIEELPQSGDFDTILVIVDRASKQVIFVPCDKHINSVGVARLFLIHVFSKHGVPSHVTADRGSEFVSGFFRALGELLSMELHFTSGHHPEADGQTERMNQTLEQYIRMYCSYQQDDWDKLLPLAEFACNNAPNASTGVSPFFANKGYHPAIDIHPERDVADMYAKDYAVDLQSLHEYLRQQITFAQTRYKANADKLRSPDPKFNIGDRVYVSAEYLRTTRPTKKFSENHLGPYEVIGKPSAASYTIRLPKALKGVHPVFHVSQLEPHVPNPFPEREEPPPAAVEIIDGESHYEIKQIVDSKIDRRFKDPAKQLRYYVEWLGYENTDEQYDWVAATDIDAPEHIANFHRRYPKKPGPLT